TNSLNHEVGGPIAEQLSALYLHLFQETTKANIDNDPKKIAHCVKILETLYSGWKEAIEKLKGGAAK
ncbi:flagellar protein FliS, partial [Acinetobacter baumannii]